MTFEHPAGWNEVRGALAAGVRCPGGRPFPSLQEIGRRRLPVVIAMLLPGGSSAGSAKNNTKTTESTAKEA
jgi:hypothetical protein